MDIVFFETPALFRKWLMEHHKTATELFVGFYKKGSGKASITWPQSVDEALCFGWIDGIRKSIDDESYFIRFTPRKADSIWSAINIKKAEELTAKHLMQPAGLESFAKRKEHKSAIYSYEKEAAELAPEYIEQFKANKKAWAFFEAETPAYRKWMIHKIMDAKQEKTRLARLEALIKDSEAGKRLEETMKWRKK